MARRVVTGGAGFLGSHLVDRLLARGDDVIVVDNLVTGSRANLAHLDDNPRLTVLEHDVTTSLTVDGPVDSILHFASPASPVDYLRLPIETLRVGSIGTLNGLELAREKEATFMLASTSEIYGDPQVHPQREDYWGHVNPIGPRSVYDEAKRFAEAATMSYRREHGVETRIARIFNTYGPRMQPDDGRVVSNFIVQALRGESLTIYGDGSQTRSFCFVDDEAAGLLALHDSDVAEPTNIGNPTEFTIAELAELVQEITGSGSTIEYRPLPTDDPTQRKPDISQARARLNWEPTVDLRDGLARTADYFRSVINR
jgi:nucleoside-diphosphate-sugar epimerase